MTDETQCKAVVWLRRLEWSCKQRCPGYGPMDSGGTDYCGACPVCRGIDPKDRFASYWMREAHGHREWCGLGKFMAELSADLGGLDAPANP